MVPPHVDGSDGSEPPPCRKLADPDVMFPVPGGKWKTKDAKAVCRRCPLDKLIACREWALETKQEFGVWGGMSQGDRKKELKRRGDVPAAPDQLAA